MNTNNNKIAVIGMSCRYPGSSNLEEYWNNLILGKETLSHFTDEELAKYEPNYESFRKNPDYVKVRGVLDDIDKFDASFFGMTPKEAAGTDPQQRIWLETAWEALENAGCDPINYRGAIGVFAGGTMSSYLINNILRDPVRMENYMRPGFIDSTQIMLGNDISYIPTKTAYYFNLRGPAIYIQTACSTSLVAIVQACQSLYSFESDICLAGGVCISIPQEKGYIYQEGGIPSPDGHCRPFDAQSKGTVGSNGVGVVILKRLEDAIRDQDNIYALVSGWALNNDGSNKVSYTAPSIDGQAEVIMMAQSFAEVSPEEISYIEAHGTATHLGDPIEIAALTKAFTAKTDKKQFCGVGSVKSNIGHTDSAAGVASFIKTCLAACHKKIPASLHYSEPNPHIDFENSPFYVQKELKEWTEERPLIMGVSSFGIGGTNAHVIVEQPPLQEKVNDSTSEWPELVLLSAKSEYSINKRKQDLIEFIKSKPDLDIHDVAYTLGTGRNHMLHRSFLVASGMEEIISEKSTFTNGKKDNLVSKIAFMFPGQGAQYVNMGKDLYNKNENFRNILDECFQIVKSETGEDLKNVLFDGHNPDEADRRLASTELTQPALFIIEYALTKVLETIDIKPDYLIGHSIGEYTAACVAGVFDMQTALKIVIRRGQLMRKMPSGNMLAVRTSIEKLQSISNSNFEIAADNASAFCTISFKSEDTEKVKALLEKNDIQYIPLNTSHAFHSASFDPIISEFRDYVNQFNLNIPELPFISCLSGTFITAEQATSGAYWAQQLRNTVLFRQGVSTIARNEGTIFLEVGPNTHLSSLIRQNKEVTNKKLIISTLGKSDNIDERYKILSALGNMYTVGININFGALKKGSKPWKVNLPSYPFERKRHWIEAELTHIIADKDSSVHKNGNDTLSLADSSSFDVTINEESVSDRTTNKIVNIWKSLIGSEEIGLDDDFFEIGGHSLLALQILTRIKEELGFKISLKDFLDNPTINKLTSQLYTEKTSIVLKDESVNEVDIKNFPLSYIQKRIWIISQLDDLNPAYNIPFTYQFKGELNIDVFRQSLNVLFNRHFIMFSVFKHKDEEPYCEIIPGPVAVELIDYSDDLPKKSEEKILSFIGQDSRKRFDLETGPLYRLYLLKQNDSGFFFHVTIHHLIFDGWSWSIFIQELKSIYENLLLNKEIELEDVKTFYLDNAKELQESDNKLNEEISTKFWIENLKGCTPKLNFPYDYPRKDVVSGFGEKENIKISSECTTKLKEIAKKEHATPFATLLSLMGLLFQRYSGENDICIGVHVANRPRSGLEKIFGMFVNTIPVRLKIDEGQTFSNFINSTKNVLLDAIAHQELPFEKLVEVVNPERSSNVNPIFQVAVQWITYSAKPLEFIGFTAEKVNVKEGVSPFDITFNLWENEGHIEGEVEYNIDILKRDTIVRLLDNFIHLVQSAVENPGKAISEISLISEYDKEKLSEFNRTEVSIPDCLIHNFFEKQAGLTPLKTAVISGGINLTYRELDNQSNQLANYLVSLGVIPGDIVGVCIERSVDMVVSVLGVLKAECCYLPMDPSFPDDRIRYMYEDSGAKVLISQSSLKEKFHQFSNTSIVLIDKDKRKISKYSAEKPVLNISSQSLAYMIYTSGSTGKPKGVKVHHQAVVNFLNSMSKKPGFSKEERLLAVTTLSFDISVLELFLPLSFGAELIIAETDDISDGQKLSGLLKLYDITVMQATPATWNILLSSGWTGKKNLKALCGGEAVLPGLIKELLPRVDSLWNMYGPTETTVWSTCHQLIDYTPPILVGTPIDNTMIYILDKNNNQLPVGVIGEVCIGGLGVTKGYNNRPELTAEKFIPFENGQIIYKTGDLGRFLINGNIELFGRIDNQIKLRGFRIEPGEIESLLSRLPDVKEAVVKVHRFDENDERLVAFLNVNSEFKMTSEEIAGFLSQHLPAYMIPSFFQTSDGFPRLPNGKINKKALLLEIDESEKKQEIDFYSLTETQKKLINIWEDILKIKNINLSGNFFDTGGNSLLAIRILNKVKEELGLTMSFKDFIAHPTIIESGKYIDSQSQIADEAIELIHLTETTNLPLSLNQKRLWLISQLLPDIPSYIIPFTYKFLGSLNREIFQKSLNILFQRHHIVFSVIKEVNGEPYCDIVPSEVDISFFDYSGLTENEKSERVNDIFNADAGKVFDLQNGPLYRVYLIMTGSDEYYFRISIHHIVFDGWSWSVLVKDLNEIYNSLLRGKEVDLKEIEFQQYDYAQWEAGRESNKKSIAYWEENMRDCSPVLNFPYDFQRTDEPSGRGGYQTIELSQELSEKLRRISKAEGSSLFTTLMSGFGVLMQKYSGEDDINIGLPVAYRPHSKLENIFGMFVNTVVVRLRYEKGLTFKNIIHKTNKAALNAIAHQDLPFEKIVELVNPERSTNINPIFQVAFDWQNNLDEPVKLNGIRSERITGKERASIFDLTLSLWENDDFIEGEFEYNTDILKPETVLRLKDHFLTLINNLAENIDLPISSVTMITDEEKRMISSVNDTQTNYPKDKTIVQLFEDQVNLYPDKSAIVFKEEALTYKQLNERANQLARTLRESGISKNTPVGLFTEKSLEMIVGILGILKAGSGYVPIDPEYPEERINFIIRDSGCKIILTQDDKYNKLPVEEVTKYSLDSVSSYHNDKSNVEVINAPSDLAYIIYTSGTTGIPKGTIIPQQGVVRLVCNTNYIDITSEDRVLQCNAIVFDASVEEIWGALLNGATLYVIDKEALLDPDSLGDFLDKNDITFVDLTSALFTQIAELRTDIFYKVKYLVLGGDVLSAPHVNKVRKDNPQLKVINTYGPTENSTNSTFYRIDRDYDHNIPIGKPISNSTAYIFDKYLNYQPVGVIGELYVGGDGLSTGYLNREELNKKSFIEHPYKTGERLYKTGDLARWLPDWDIEFRGRSDNQVKIRGFRVELEEIESVISEIDGVIETVIKTLKVEEGDYKLVAFLNVPETFNKEPDEILLQIKAKLPAYMVPSAFKYMYGFPKTVNGKTDRKALSFDTKELWKRERIDLTAISTTERTIHKIWCEALKTDDVILTDNFFDIGGNSLLAIRILNKIKEELGFKMSFKTFIAYPTILQAANYIDSQSQTAEKAIELVHLTETTNLPLTLNQKRLWLISKLQPDIPSYIMPYSFKFLGSLNREIFQKSLNILFQRHHIVFSVIKEVNGEPYCDIVPSEVDISFIDYSGLPENERSEKVNEVMNADSRKVFDLQNGPLYRLYLIMTGSDEYYFRISIHHIIFDGWSWPVLAEDINNIYNSLLRGKEVGLEEIEFQQYDYAQWEKSSADSKHEEKSIEFWKENLNGASPILNFPYDFQRTGKPSGRGGYETIQLSQDLSEKLRMISKDEGSSLFATMLSAFGIQMQKYSGEDDINIGLPVVYRPHSKLENIFGMFVNTVVVRLRNAKEFTFRNVIHKTIEAALNAISHQDLPFEKVVEIVNPERSSNVNPLFQVAFAWQNNLDEPIKLDGIRSESIAGKERNSIFDIIFYLWENGNHIEGEFEYNIDILRHDTIIRLRDNFLNLINNLVENSDTALESLSMISDEEKKMIDGFNDTLTDYPKEKTIIQLFEDQVYLYPDKTAVVFKEDSLTYKQLNERTNQLARTLRKSGVRDNTPVGILAEKSLDMIVGILGILKSGGGYVPIDPEYPEQRINFMIKDSDCKVLLTQDKYMKVPVEGVGKLNLNSPETFNKEKSNVENINRSTDLAYIMYTSGTTGLPKGSMIGQKSVVRLVRNTDYLDFKAEDRILLTGAIVFDATTFEIWGALLNGGTLYIVEKETILNPKALGEELFKNEITILWLTSALFTQIAETRTDIFGKLKYLLSGGDVLSASHINKVRKDNPNLKVLNCYGPTENTTFSTTYLIDKDFDTNIPIGKPISNSTTYIFDKNMNYQPIGVIGELYVGGDGLSMGYLNREDLNKKSFIDHPHIPGERLYRTGDYARWLPDGNIEFHGRIDNQLKIRGFRVELGEIESVISEIDGIIETVVKPIKIDEGDIRLAAFLNVSDTFSMGTKELSRQIKEKLPPYMVPSAFKLMNGFPKTINGKIDKDALSLDVNDLFSKESQDLRTFTPTEMKIYNIWSEALKTKDISATDNFFDVGGNSLIAISVFSSIESEFDVDLGLRVFFDSPRIKDLAEAIDVSKYKDVEQKSFKKTKGNGARIIEGEI